MHTQHITNSRRKVRGQHMIVVQVTELQSCDKGYLGSLSVQIRVHRSQPKLLPSHNSCINPQTLEIQYYRLLDTNISSMHVYT